MEKLEYKFAKFNVKETDDERGELSGCANFCGYLDDGGDIIPTGGFSNVLQSFLKGGFIAHSHEWNIKDGVIGYPIEAHEDEDGLFLRARFHSTTDAQDIRTKIKERNDDGLETGLSIGFRGGAPVFVYPKDYEKELPKYLKPEFLDEGLQKARKFKNVRVLPKLSALKEISVVTSPMNILSAVDGVKDATGQREALTFAPLNTAWDAKVADQRVMQWAAKQADPKSAYQSAFILPDEDFGKHRFLFCDVIDDHLQAVEAGIKNAVDQLFILNITGEPLAKARGRISAYYRKMKEQFPDVSVKIDWTPNELADETERLLEHKFYQEKCSELGIEEEKVGARNAGADRKRLQQMHDLAVQMQPDVCPGYSTKSVNAEVKEIFDEELSRMSKPDPYRIWSAFCETMRRIKGIKAASNGQVDTDSMLDSAISSMTDSLYEAALEELNGERDANSMMTSFYGETIGQTKEESDETTKDEDTPPVTDIGDWKREQYRTEKLRTAAMRQRAGLKSSLSIGA